MTSICLAAWSLASVALAFPVTPAVPTISPSVPPITGLGNAAGYGSRASLSGSIGIIGQDFNSDVAPAAGAANLVDLNTGQALGTLRAPDGEAGDRFGISVDISGTTAVVGAWLHDSSSLQYAGAAYLYDTTDPENPLFLHELIASDAHALAELGGAVATDGVHAIAGAHENAENPYSPGSAYIFNVATGGQTAKLTPTNGTLGDLFGVSVDISGDLAIVGDFAGSAYLFDVNSGLQLAKLVAPRADPGGLFGRAVSIDGNTVLIGALTESGQGLESGAAYLFDISEVDSPREIARLTAPDLGFGALFGNSVALDGDIAIVGASGDARFSNPTGAAYAYNAHSGELLGKLVADDLTAGDHFGRTVSVSGSRVLIGTSNGSVYAYQVGVPEPATALLAAFGGCLGGLRRRRGKSESAGS